MERRGAFGPRRGRTGLLLGSGAWLALCLLTPFSRAEPAALTNAVLVGGQPVPRLALGRALDGCALLTPPRAPRECVTGDAAHAWRLARYGAAQKLDESLTFRRVARRVLADRLGEHEASSLPAPSTEELRKTIKQNSREFMRPERLRLFRILLPSEADARELRAKFGPGTTLTEWRAAARERSLDRATHERGGDLGFVAPDGTTDVPEVRVDPALYQAARALTDGEIAPGIVREGEHFALVWRRGHLPPVETPLREIERLATASLLREKAATRVQELTRELRKTQLREHHPERLELLRGAGRMYPLR